jgi:hypothetical protein
VLPRGSSSRSSSAAGRSGLVHLLERALEAAGVRLLRHGEGVEPVRDLRARGGSGWRGAMAGRGVEGGGGGDPLQGKRKDSKEGGVARWMVHLLESLGAGSLRLSSARVSAAGGSGWERDLLQVKGAGRRVTMDGYISVYSWVSPIMALFRFSTVLPIG